MAMCPVNWREGKEGLTSQRYSLGAAREGQRPGLPARLEMGQQMPKALHTSPSWAGILITALN